MIQVQDNDHIWNSLEKKVLINGKEFALTFKVDDRKSHSFECKLQNDIVTPNNCRKYIIKN